MKFQRDLQDTECWRKYSIKNKAEGGESPDGWEDNSHKTDSSPPVLK